MAKNSDIVDSINTLNQTVSASSNSAGENIEQLGERIESAIGELGDGLKLSEKRSAEKSESAKGDKTAENNEKLAKLREQLEGLRVLSPELAEIAETLISINTEMLINSDREEERILKEEEEGEPEINTDAKEAKELAGLTNLTSVTGTGLAIVSNLLTDISNDLAELRLKILEGATSGSDMKATEIRSENKLSGDEARKEADKKDAGESKGKLAAFFQGISGPLESVAGSLLMIAIAMAILQAVHFESEMILTVINLMAFMTLLFLAVSFISQGYLEVSQYFDTEGKQEGSMTQIMQSFALMIATVTATILLSRLLVEILKDAWPQVIGGMILIFAGLFTSLIALAGMALIMNALVDTKDSPIMQFVRAFATLVGTIVVLALICYLLHDIIEIGLGYAMKILLATGLLMVGIGIVLAIIADAGVTDKQIDAFKDLMIVTVVLIGILAILTIVLGVIPEETIMQGIVTVGLLVGMVVVLLGMLAIGIKAIQKVKKEQLWALMGILIVTTVMIAVLSILVIVLGSQDPSVIIQGMVTLGLLMTIPFIIVKTMSKLGRQAAQVAQALVGVVLAGVVTVALAAVGFIIISMFASFSMEQVLVASVAVVLTTALLIVVGAAAIGIAVVTPYLAAATPLALAGIALAGVIAIAIAGIAALLASVLKPEVAKAAILAATAIILTTTALVLVASSAIVLAGLAIPLVFAADLALVSIRIVGVLLAGIAAAVVGPIVLASTMLQSVDLEALQTGITAMKNILKIFVGMVAVVVAFALIGAILVTNLSLVGIILGGILISLGIITLTLVAVSALVTQIPDSIDFSKISGAVTSLNSFSEAVNKFEAPSLGKLLAVDFAMSFVARFARRLGKLGDDGTIAKVQTLANSLSELANQATGMQELASAIDAVAKATSDLNEVNEQSKISVEALSGQGFDQAQMLKEIKEAPPEKDNSSEQIEKVLAAIGELTSEMRGIRDSLSAIAISAENNSKFGGKDVVSSEYGMATL